MDLNTVPRIACKCSYDDLDRAGCILRVQICRNKWLNIFVKYRSFLLQIRILLILKFRFNFFFISFFSILRARLLLDTASVPFSRLFSLVSHETSAKKDV